MVGLRSIIPLGLWKDTVYFNPNIRKYYDVTDAVILWYGVVALVISYPIAYIFGYVLYCIKHTWKEMMYLKIEWKKILVNHFIYLRIKHPLRQ